MTFTRSASTESKSNHSRCGAHDEMLFFIRKARVHSVHTFVLWTHERDCVASRGAHDSFAVPRWGERSHFRLMQLKRARWLLMSFHELNDEHCLDRQIPRGPPLVSTISVRTSYIQARKGMQAGGVHYKCIGVYTRLPALTGGRVCSSMLRVHCTLFICHRMSRCVPVCPHFSKEKTRSSQRHGTRTLVRWR